MFRRQLQPNTAHKFIYCGIEKAGSTFWRRLLQYIQLSKVQTPYRIRPELANAYYVDISKSNLLEVLGVLKSFTKFIFVRNPYTRLLSGFIDKIYSPNPYYWNKIGMNAISLARGITNACGHDVSFKEFVEYIIHSNNNPKSRRDVHFIPAHQLCLPCYIQYDFIGKIESFEKDVLFILEKLNLTQYLPVLRNFKNQSVFDALYDVSHTFIEFRKEASKCLSYEESLKRTWRKLQLRGIIADEINLPFPYKESENITEEKLLLTFINANKQSQTFDLRSQKRKYLIDAFSTLSLQTLDKLADVFMIDFKIFDYNIYPSFIFQNKNISSQDIF
ncbi:carbohydrate sulfotransferase 9-like [Mytilus californianus]|uniref:carbohydrate sulfotransferase 9-like n=1 Tax=Mytilus californianus TaxID=6549 RepID=UPI002245E65C|nr:carbohydrate sulfotransferase 9-like [Mytilus californianus]